MRMPLRRFLLLCLAGAAQRAAAGGVDASALDTSADPCVDFYQFACGGWRQANPVPPDQTRWGRFNELAERNRNVLHEILEKVRGGEGTRSATEAKVGDYYAACMDEAGIEKQGTKPLEPLLARIDGLGSKADLFRLFGEHETHGLPALFAFGSAPDLHDSGQTIAMLGQGGLGLPDRDDYLKDDAASKEKREKYREHVAALLKLAGEGEGPAAEDARTVLRVEAALANAQLDRVSLRDPKNRDNPMTVEELKSTFPAFEFTSYFGGTAGPTVSRVNLTSRRFFQEGNGVV